MYMFVINEHNPVKPLSIVSEGAVEKKAINLGK
jgi:hypothetical protein